MAQGVKTSRRVASEAGMLMRYKPAVMNDGVNDMYIVPKWVWRMARSVFGTALVQTEKEVRYNPDVPQPYVKKRKYTRRKK